MKFQRHDNLLKVDSTVHASPIPPHLYQKNCSFNSKTVSCHTFHFPRTDNTDTVKPVLKSTGNAFNIFHSTQHSIQRSEDLFQAVHTLQTVLWLTPVYIVHGLFGRLRDKKTVGSRPCHAACTYTVTVHLCSEILHLLLLRKSSVHETFNGKEVIVSHYSTTLVQD